MTDRDRFRWWIPAVLVLISWLVLTGCGGNSRPWGPDTYYQDQAEYCAAMRQKCDGDQNWQDLKTHPDNPLDFLEVAEPEYCRAIKRDC